MLHRASLNLLIDLYCLIVNAVSLLKNFMCRRQPPIVHFRALKYSSGDDVFVENNLRGRDPMMITRERGTILNREELKPEDLSTDLLCILMSEDN